MVTFPTGSGILLCPTGVGFSTISDEEFEYFESLDDAGTSSIKEIDFSVYQEWLSNAREIEVITELSYAPTTDYFVDETTSSTFKQGIGDVTAASVLEFNDSPHPFPMMDYASNKLSFRADLNGGTSPYIDENGNLKSFGFGYYFLSGLEQNPPPLPFLFIRNDKFYWLSSVANKTVFTLTANEYKEFFTDTIEVPAPDGGEGTVTVTEKYTYRIRITERFY